MKFFTVIFSIYILVLSCVPCVDGGEKYIKLSPEISATENHKHTADLCTPFCSCTCCGQPVASKINYPIAQTVLKPENFKNSIAIYNQTFISQFSATIWQPPIIS